MSDIDESEIRAACADVRCAGHCDCPTCVLFHERVDADEVGRMLDVIDALRAEVARLKADLLAVERLGEAFMDERGIDA